MTTMTSGDLYCHICHNFGHSSDLHKIPYREPDTLIDMQSMSLSDIQQRLQRIENLLQSANQKQTAQPSPRNDDDSLIDGDELAEWLKLEPRTIQAWRYWGKGPAFVRISKRCIRYRKGTVREWMKNRERTIEDSCQQTEQPVFHSNKNGEGSPATNPFTGAVQVPAPPAAIRFAYEESEEGFAD